jgi:hypothetical protein
LPYPSIFIEPPLPPIKYLKVQINISITGFDSYTTSSQQLHNNPSYEGGSQCVGLILMWEVVVQLLYWCCKSNIFRKLLDHLMISASSIHTQLNPMKIGDISINNYLKINNHFQIHQQLDVSWTTLFSQSVVDILFYIFEFKTQMYIW